MVEDIYISWDYLGWLASNFLVREKASHYLHVVGFYLLSACTEKNRLKVTQ